jgi:hypothetical protein
VLFSITEPHWLSTLSSYLLTATLVFRWEPHR